MAMTPGQSAAFNAVGAGWLSAGTAQLFFASLFAALALFLLSLLVLECYAAWQSGSIGLGEGGRLILEFSFFVVLLLFLIR